MFFDCFSRFHRLLSCTWLAKVDMLTIKECASSIVYLTVCVLLKNACIFCVNLERHIEFVGYRLNNDV